LVSEELNVPNVHARIRHFLNHPPPGVVAAHLPDWNHMKRRTSGLRSQQNGNVMADNMELTVVADVP
jgi:hypothetical protein